MSPPFRTFARRIVRRSRRAFNVTRDRVIGLWPRRPKADIVFVVAEQNRGWILEAICQEIAQRSEGTVLLHYGRRPLPPARAFFFSHYLLQRDCLGDPALRRATSLVFFTHPSYHRDQAPEVVGQLGRATAVISMSSLFARELLADGLPPDKLHVLLPGADPDRFVPHRRGGGAVGFCSAYQPRKRPDRIVGLVAAMPHRRFVLLGRSWRAAPGFTDLEALPNFTYLEGDYATYPDFYSQLDVLVSPSELEGGPIPLLEAMMANVVPVATATGFAGDLIEHGVNGFICPVDAPLDHLIELVEAACAHQGDVRSSVNHHTWDRFAAQVLALARR